MVLFVSWSVSPALAGPCPFGISPETSQQLFARMKTLSVGAGYRAEGVATNKSELFMHWSLNGAACPPIRALVDSCWSTLDLPVFQLDVPPEVVERCPALPAAVREFSQPAGRRGGLLAAVTVALATALMIRRSRWWALFIAAALPLFLPPYLALAIELGAAWIAFAVLLYDRERIAGHSREQRRAMLGLFGFSLVLNYCLSSGGPGDLRMNLAGIWASALELRWGPAPIALFRVLGFILGGIQDTDIRCINLIVSSCVPLLLYAIVFELGVSQLAALLAAAVVAAHPMLISVSGVLERQPLYLFAACGSTLALITFLRRGGWDRFAAFVLGTMLAVTTRPEGAHVLVPHFAVLLLVRSDRRSRAAVVTAMAIIAALAAAYLSYGLESKAPIGRAWLAANPLLWTILFDPDFTPLAWIAAGICGLVLGARQRAAWVAIATVFVLDLLWWRTGLYTMFVGYERQVASARYETILLIPFALCIALCAQALLRMPWMLKIGFAAAFIAGTAATFGRTYDTLIKPFTIDYEFAFLKKYALSLPASARLYVFNAPLDDVGLIDAHLVGQFVGSPVTFRTWSDRRCDDWPSAAAATYLYVGSSCAELRDAPGRSASLPDNLQWLQDCRAMRERLAGDLVDEVEVPARKMSWHNFKEQSVRLSLYRVNDSALCSMDSK